MAGPKKENAPDPNAINVPPYTQQLIRDIIEALSHYADDLHHLAEANAYLMPCVIGLLTGLITALFAYQFGVDGQRGLELLDWILTLPWLEKRGDW